MKVVPHFGGRFRGRPVEIRRSGGAPGGAAPVQRASQTRWTFGAAPRERASQPRSSGARSRSLASSGKGSRKPLAPPGAPFAFWNGNRERAAPRPLIQQGQ